MLHLRIKNTFQHVAFPHVSSLFHMNLTLQASIQNLLQKPFPLAGPYQSHSDGCEGLRAVANTKPTSRKQRYTLTLPKVLTSTPSFGGLTDVKRNYTCIEFEISTQEGLFLEDDIFSKCASPNPRHFENIHFLIVF